MQFVLLYLSLLLLATLTISGWFMITRGSTETLPDGTTLKKGKVFREWYFFWTQQWPSPIKIYYRGDQLRKLCKQMEQHFPYKDGMSALIVHEGSIAIVPIEGRPYVDLNRDLKKLEELYSIVFEAKGDGYYAIYKEYPNPVFPWWVSHPLAVCATCHSSLYGSVFYWISMAFCADKLYSWAEFPILAMLLGWPVFLLSLSVTVTYVVKKVN